MPVVDEEILWNSDSIHTIAGTGSLITSGPNYDPGEIVETHSNQPHVITFLSNQTEGMEEGIIP
jgi:hypothetical protein